MSLKEDQNMADKNLGKQIPNNVVAIGASTCCAEDCKKKSDLAGFCHDHFAWFKAGLITREGAKAADFDKKHYQWELSKAKRKAA
jgi:hypothetical protein